LASARSAEAADREVAAAPADQLEICRTESRGCSAELVGMLCWTALLFIVGIIAAALGTGTLAAAGAAKALFILGSAAHPGRQPSCPPAPL
jgi:uncharacterized membrane protein YtjA (UPF0391 family)